MNSKQFTFTILIPAVILLVLFALPFRTMQSDDTFTFIVSSFEPGEKKSIPVVTDYFSKQLQHASVYDNNVQQHIMKRPNQTIDVYFYLTDASPVTIERVALHKPSTSQRFLKAKLTYYGDHQKFEPQFTNASHYIGYAIESYEPHPEKLKQKEWDETLTDEENNDNLSYKWQATAHYKNGVAIVTKIEPIKSLLQNEEKR